MSRRGADPIQIPDRLLLVAGSLLLLSVLAWAVHPIGEGEQGSGSPATYTSSPARPATTAAHPPGTGVATTESPPSPGGAVTGGATPPGPGTPGRGAVAPQAAGQGGAKGPTATRGNS